MFLHPTRRGIMHFWTFRKSSPPKRPLSPRHAAGSAPRAPEALEPRRMLAAVLVKDIQTETASSFPAGYTVVGSVAYFAADDGVNGRELWRTDGTAAGTRLVKDINPAPATYGLNGEQFDGANTGSSSPSGLVNVNGTLFFFASDGTRGYELWKSDGTEAGTVLVKDINPGAASSYNIDSPAGGRGLKSAAVGNVFYFTAYDPATGLELFRSDGTPDGTRLVVDLYPGPGGTTVSEMVNANGTLAFVTEEGASRALYRSDGTAAGTSRVSAAAGLTTVGGLTAAGPTLYFWGVTPAAGRELWRSAPVTPAGLWPTAMVKDIRPGAAGSFAGSFTPIGNTVYFSADDGVSGAELWKTDGTANGTVMVRDVRAGAPSASPGMLANVNGTLLFTATDDATTARKLYRSNGTAAGTTRVTTMPALPRQSPAQMTVVGNTLFFTHEATNSFEPGAPPATTGWLWKTDGTIAGTTQVQPTNPTAWKSTALTAFGNRLLFTAADPSLANFEPWTSNGTAAGTTRLADVNTVTRSADPVPFVAGGSMWFAAASPAGSELWKSDGTTAGTVMVKDINAGAGGSTPGGFAYRNGVLYFAATDAAGDRELWKSNGTSGGTVRVKDIYAGGSSQPRELTVFNNAVYFAARDADGNGELWKTDGSEAGTVLVKKIRPGLYGSEPAGLTVMNGSLYFFAYDGTSTGLFRSDGTDAGTVMVHDVTASGQSRPANVMTVGGKLYFQTSSPDGYRYSLWQSDGTAAGTRHAATMDVSFDAIRTAAVVDAAGPAVYFVSRGATNNTLFRLDGATGAIAAVTDAAGAAPLAPTNLQAVGNQLYFSAFTAAAGYEPWRTDGTRDGTMRVADVYPGGHSYPANFTAWQGKVYFTAADARGRELWATDGTPDGTGFVADIQPGPGGSDPRAFTVYNNQLFVTANDRARGAELWRVLPNVAPSVASVAVAPGPDAGLVMLRPAGLNDPDGAVRRVRFYRESNGTPGLQTGAGGDTAIPATGVAPNFTALAPVANLPAGTLTFYAEPVDELGTAGPAASTSYTHYAAVAARHVFYNGSALDGGDPAADARDDAAIGTASALRPGQPAGAAHVTNFSRGITGVMVDVAGLPAGATPSAADFEIATGNGTTWSPAPAAPTVSVRRGAGSSGSDRVTLAVPAGAIRNTWLRVTVKPTANTGLSAPDVFYYGNLVGDTGGRGAPTVDAADLARTRAAVGKTSAAALANYDFNRDGTITAVDVLLVRNNQRRSLPPFTTPATAAAASASGSDALATAPPAQRSAARPARRGLLDDAPPTLPA